MRHERIFTERDDALGTWCTRERAQGVKIVVKKLITDRFKTSFVVEALIDDYCEHEEHSPLLLAVNPLTRLLSVSAFNVIRESILLPVFISFISPTCTIIG